MVREILKTFIYYRHETNLPHSLVWVNLFFKMIGCRSGVFFHCRCAAIYLLIILFFPLQVFAAAGDVINNTATVSFSYLGVPLTLESSPTGNTNTGPGNGVPTTFVEDQVVNFIVASSDISPVDVAANETNAFLTFTVMNTGNATQDFLLTAINTSPNPFPVPVENIDPVLLRVFVEDGTDTSGYQSLTDTGLFIDDLAPGATATVYVVANIPAAAIGDLAAVALVVQVATGGVPGAGAAITNDDNNHISPAGAYSNGTVNVSAGTAFNTADTAGVDLVFGDPAGAAPEDVDSAGLLQDAANNGQSSDAGAFLVQTVGAAVDPLIKTVTVIDTLGGTDPHPGATLRYQIVVNTTGTSTVDDLVITDSIPVNTTYTPNSITLNGVPQTDADETLLVPPPIDYSNHNDPARLITVDLSEGGSVSISTATTNTITFDVTID